MTRQCRLTGDHNKEFKSRVRADFLVLKKKNHICTNTGHYQKYMQLSQSQSQCNLISWSDNLSETPTLEWFQPFRTAFPSPYSFSDPFTCLGAVGLLGGLSSETYSWPLSLVVTSQSCAGVRTPGLCQWQSYASPCSPHGHHSGWKGSKIVQRTTPLLSKWIPFRVSPGILHFLPW